MKEINTSDKYIVEKSGGPRKVIKEVTYRRNPHYQPTPKRLRRARPDLGDWYDNLVDQLVNERLARRLTQQALASQLRTKQSVVSEFESKLANPSLLFLTRYARTLGKDLVVTLR